jgi:phosphohistidine swiveling domain-containing protein
MHIIALPGCEDALSVAGGKAVGLARLNGYGFPVPPGFAVTTRAYRDSVLNSGVAQQIDRILSERGVSLPRRAARVRALFTPDTLIPEVSEAITAAYLELCGDRGNLPVAVRSSATAEDLQGASFAGQQDTYLWVEGVDAVLGKVVECWSSLFTDRAIEYRDRLDQAFEDLAMAVVVQEMVDAAAAGVMMTLHPVTGDRTAIYIESAHGLGETVVRGEVDPDQFVFERDTLTVRSAVIGHKPTMWTPSSAHRESRRVEVPVELRDAPSVTDAEAREIAQLGRAIDVAFGMPMDIEWAIGPDSSGDRSIQILQARPETVWGAARLDNEIEDWDPLDQHSAPHLHWSTSNLGEACPGVLTPLSWSVWSPVIEASAREAGYAIGALTKAERAVPEDVSQRYLRIFKGRPAMQLEFMATIGDRMPGTTGSETIAGLFGHVPANMTFTPTKRRYPVIAWRFPRSFVTIPRRAQRLAADTDGWWRGRIAELPTAGSARARAILAEAQDRLLEAVKIQSILNLASIQPMWSALRGVIAAAGVGDEAVLGGYGGPEMDVVRDITDVAFGVMSMHELLARHGFHGPMEGELSSTVWREDPAPLERLLQAYRDSTRLAVHDESKARALEQAQADVLAALPRVKRQAARLILKLAAVRLPQRGVPKRAFVQALDVTRAAARRLGHHLAEDGVLDTADDVFYLVLEELLVDRPAPRRDLVERRRARRAEYAARTYPSEWSGRPDPIVARAENSGVLSGLGVSSGLVEGEVTVVRDPAAAEVAPGTILVAPTTDPSWSSLMFISAALVVDIGGALSHCAVVARELGIPCVVNTRGGSRQLRTGDRVRVDGALGTVEILARAGDAEALA